MVKKLAYFVALAALILLSACVRTEENSDLVTLTVSSGDVTKTDVNLYSGTVTFSANDRIGVIDKSGGRISAFITAQGGNPAQFKGYLDKGCTEAVVWYPYSSSACYKSDTLRQLSLPHLQTMIQEGVDPDAHICYGELTRDGNSLSASLKNLCSIVKFNVGFDVAKVILRSNDSSDVLACEGGLYISNDSKTLEVDELSDTYSSITLTHSGAATNSTMAIAVLPCTMSKGFTLEFYTRSIDDVPVYARTTSKETVLEAGTILNLGPMSINTDISVYANYGMTGDGWFYYKNGQQQIVYADPLEECAFSPDIMEFDGIDYSSCNLPMPGQKCCLRIFVQDYYSAGGELLLGGAPLSTSHKGATIGGEYFTEYAVADFEIPQTAPGEMLYLPLSVGTEILTYIPVPYCNVSADPATELISGRHYAIARDGRYVCNTGKDYDYKVLTSAFDQYCIWKFSSNGEGFIVSNIKNDRVYYLQHQNYRTIGYISKQSGYLDLYGTWTLDDSSLEHDGALLYDSGTEELLTDLYDSSQMLKVYLIDKIF